MKIEQWFTDIDNIVKEMNEINKRNMEDENE